MFQIAIMIFVVAMIGGCGPVDNENKNNKDKEKEQGSIEMQLYQVGSAGGAAMGVSSETGYYQVQPIIPGSYNILYTDYATNQQIFLCEKPNCNHQDESCSSYIDASKGNIPGLVYSDHKIFIIEAGAVSDDCYPKIEVMNEDGSEKKLLKQFAPNQIVNSGWYLADQKNLYYMMEEATATGEYQKSLCSINKTTGESEVIQTFENDVWILDGLNDKIYLKTIEQPDVSTIKEEYFASSDEFKQAVEKAYNGRTHKIWTLNLNTKEEALVDQYDDSERSGTMIDGAFYYFEPSSNQFVKKRL